MADKALNSTCHCGAITVVMPHQPEEINECQCTICRRYAAAWAYYKVNEVKIDIKEGAKLSQCYWWPLEEKKADGSIAVFGVNTRNMDPMEIFHVNRRIEKAWLLQPLKDKTLAHEQDQARY
ncbi:glutathione-dependent formaldehyde-activating GFA [Penicillium pulvis]|uniref:glutathione-dependent formaldehyde-activating GFA n=1 Tax=Penicillium pulvis TaxID=1562058 RepID=UPI002546EEF6|nr:glutathione-dependent formaldehyde-activating GFA [Penicillium pulvis]KAJ5806536.1 glutathione-dependent formaldehyde-activating GFA [Penicillium pulvis]